MKSTFLQLTAAGACACGLLFFSGCAAVRVSTQDVSPQDMEHFHANYDATDMRKITENMVGKILDSQFLAQKNSPPVMMISGVENRTLDYVDTKNLTDRMRTMLLKSGRMQFINMARRDALLKEQGYQAANATAATQTEIGRQVGAKYMISGSLTEMRQESGRQVRVSTQKVNYYKLTMEITDLESSLIIWTDEEEFARNESQPMIGW